MIILARWVLKQTSHPSALPVEINTAGRKCTAQLNVVVQPALGCISHRHSEPWTQVRGERVVWAGWSTRCGHSGSWRATHWLQSVFCNSQAQRLKRAVLWNWAGYRVLSGFKDWVLAGDHYTVSSSITYLESWQGLVQIFLYFYFFPTAA